MVNRFMKVRKQNTKTAFNVLQYSKDKDLKVLYVFNQLAAVYNEHL